MRRSAATLTLLCALIAPSTTAAVAAPTDPTPDPGRSGSVPSTAQVTRARAAVDTAAARQAQLEAQVAATADRLDALETRAQVATESYNAARAELTARTRAAVAASSAATRATQRAAQARDDVDSLAATAYMQGGEPSVLDELLGLTAGTDPARNAADLDAVGAYRHTTYTDATRAAAAATTAQAAAARAQAQQQEAAGAARTSYVAATNAVARAQVEQRTLQARQTAAIAELAALRRTSAAVEQARLDGLAAQAARAAMTTRRATAAAPARYSAAALPAADSDAAARAIDFAKAQLGKPYEWAAEGPDTYDCSGLTMKAWEAGGRSLVHYSQSQYDRSARVPIEDLQPGDLVFFGADDTSIHHVGLYVGDGQMIEAPYTGAVVRYRTIYRKGLLDHGGRI